MKKSLAGLFGVVLLLVPTLSFAQTMDATTKAQLISALYAEVALLEQEIQQILAAQAVQSQQIQQVVQNTTPTVATVPSINNSFSTTTQETPTSGVMADNFNSYSNGPVVGQGGWINRANGTSWVVESTTTEEGSGALYNNNTGTDSIITKTGTNASTDGTQSYWVYPQNPQSWGSYDAGENVQMGLYQGSWDGPTRTVMAFMQDGHVAYIDPTVNKFVEFDTYNANAWNLAQIQWSSSDDTARFRVNNGAWSNWIPFVGANSFTGFDTVGFATFSLGTGGVYIDNLQ